MIRLDQYGTSVCRVPGRKGFGVFRNPVLTERCSRTSELRELVSRAESHSEAGNWVVMMLSYEAAPAFDPSMPGRENTGFPHLCFAVYDSDPEEFIFSGKTSCDEIPELEPEVSPRVYSSRVERILRYIYEGDIYQANYTFRMRSGPCSNPGELFQSLVNSHPVPYAAYFNGGDFQVLSISPELFLERTGSLISSLPMKGTVRRALSAREDIELARMLETDRKNRAENVMITDMVRNDLGRVCRPGSIYVDPLFRIDTYRTVHQMVSGVHGSLRNDTGLFDLLSATFPPASIVGAPKIRAMEIIRETEKSPRGIYTGSIGCISPGKDLLFNVAIRTLCCTDRECSLGVGGGIVADSEPGDEWRESILKSRFVSFTEPEFDVLETMLYEKPEGIVDLDEHLQRAELSQKYFGRQWDREVVIEAMENLTFPDKIRHARVRLLVSRDGSPRAEYAELENAAWNGKRLRIMVSDKRMDSSDCFLYHKTTRRHIYDCEFRKAVSSGYDEVLFINEKGEITEGAISNLVLEKNGKYYTPPVSCGLLPGIWRNRMMRENNVEEKILYPEDLAEADRIIMGNSVRGPGPVKCIARIFHEITGLAGSRTKNKIFQ